MSDLPDPVPPSDTRADAPARGQAATGASTSPPKRRGGIAAAVLTVTGLLALAASAPWTEFGTQVLLSFVPGLKLHAPAGTLFGDFQADRMSLALGAGQTLVIDRPQWQPWRLDRDAAGRWQLHTAQLRAARATLQGQASSTGPTQLPTDLRLPIGLQIDQLALAQLDIGLPAPVRDLQAGVTLASGPVAQHRLSDLRFAWERLVAGGSLQIEADAPMGVQATLDLRPDASAPGAGPATASVAPPAAAAAASTPRTSAPRASPAPAANPAAEPAPDSLIPADWQAHFNASGPLHAIELAARIQAAGQQLTAQASLALAAPWPVSRLEVQAQGLDLAPLGAGLPVTALSGSLQLQPLQPTLQPPPPTAPQPPQTAALPASTGTQAVRLQVQLSNARPGRVGDGALPLTELQVSAQSDLEHPDRGRLERLAVSLADGRESAGEIHGDGQWQLEGQGLARVLRWSVQTEVRDLQPARLSAAAPALHLRGPVTSSGAWPWPAAAAGAPARGVTPPASAAARSSRAERAAQRAAAKLAAAASTAPATTTTMAPPTATPARTVGAGTAPVPGAPAAPQWRLRADLGSQFEAARLPEVRLQLEAQGGRDALAIDRFEATAGPARARVQARLAHLAPNQRDASSGWAGPWQLALEGTLQDVDPTVWWPGLSVAPQSPWRRGPHRLNSHWKGQLTAQIPPNGSGAPDPRFADRVLRSLQGELQGELDPSRLGGQAVSGRLRIARAAATGAQADAPLQLSAELSAGAGTRAAPNRLQLDGRLDTAERGTQDHWQLRWSAPQLAGLGDLVRLAAGAAGTDWPALDGDSEGQLQLDGRWPAVASQGQASTRALTLRPAGAVGATARWRLRGGDLRWQGATTGSEPLSASLKLDELRQGEAADAARLEALTADLRGRPAAHRLSAQADLLPGAAKPRSAPERGRLRLVADGALTGPGRDETLDWTGQLQALTLRAVAAAGAPGAPASAASGPTPSPADLGTGEGAEWLRLDPASLHLRLGPASRRAEVGPTRLHADRSTVTLETLQWQQQGDQASQVQLKARLESLLVAPWLQRAQPGYGWRGDLQVAGRIEASGGPGDWRVDADLHREQGDLIVEEPALTGGPQALGLAEIRLGLSARGGRWRLSQRVVGSQLGTLEGEQTVQGSAQAWAPAGSDAVSGRIDLRIEQLGKVGDWGRWLPAGWRVGGQAQAQARVSGRLDSPRLSGDLRGQQITVRNALEGVDWQGAELRVALDGENARIEQFSVLAGSGRLDISGQAVLGATPRADLQVKAERFAVLQRVDRRLVVSGQATIGLSALNTSVRGSLRADEGRIDFTRGDAPALSDDVTVVRSTDKAETASAPDAPKEARRQTLDLKLDLGKAFALKGRGLNTRLEGELQLTSPANRLSATGTIRAVEGTYAAYGQKLAIDRGDIVFRGPVDNPRLDIQATRADLDEVRVGVAITGTTQNPRIRLFSDPEMTDNDKLSWLLLGRGSDGLARTDLALLQRAAYALVAGESDSPSLMQRLGVDSLSVRQETDGDVRATVVSLGKQISRRWYVGYERSLSATAGTWQLIYRIAQRFTLRAQSGAENAIDLIWTWKWGEPSTATPATGGAAR